MTDVIIAAIIQAAPLLLAAVAAIIGLGTWRTQQRSERHLVHAEQALASAAQTFSLIRAARSPLAQIPEEKSGDRKSRMLALRRVAIERLSRSWEAWRAFQSHYTLAGLFADPNDPRTDVAKAVADCFYDLQDHAETAFYYGSQLLDDPGDQAARQENVKASRAFYGSRSQAKPDEIEVRLRDAEATLQSELRPILRPPSKWTRIMRCFTRRSARTRPAGSP